MKSKIINSQNQDSQDAASSDNVEVESGGPSIAASKKSKIAIIAASSVLVTLVIYFMFFKGEEKKPEKLEAVAPAVVTNVASSDSGKSVFEIDMQKPKDDLDLLKKPAAPETPKLPELPVDAAAKDPSPVMNVLIPKDLRAPENNPTNQQSANQAANQNNQGLNPTNQQNPNAAQNAKELDPRYSPIIVVKGAVADGGPSLGVGYDKTIVKLKEDDIDKLEKTKTTVKTTYIEDRNHTIAQGKLLTAVLETAINTEIPGFVRAIVSRDVYGEAGKDVLIPRGSRLFGSYSSRINRGQGRVEISWSRLIRPDGVDLAITFNASDQFGRSGIQGETDNKYSAVIANSMLTSILAVGSVAAIQKLLTNDGTTVTTNNPQQGTVTTTGNASNQALYDVSRTVVDTVGQVISNSLDLQPIIRIPQGTRITVIVNSDIKIPSMKR